MELLVTPGTFLAAAPNLLDPNFMHTVVLMCQHDEEGAIGLVVNRRAEVVVSDLFPTHVTLMQSDFPVHVGGPVGGDTLQFVHRVPEHIHTAHSLGGGVYIGGGLEALASYLERTPREEALRNVRLILGYAGWGARQLDFELSGGSWLPAPVDENLVFGPADELTWRRVVRSVHSRASGYEDLPPDPTWN